MDELVKTIIRVGMQLQPIADHMIREFAQEFARTLVYEVRDKWQQPPEGHHDDHTDA